MEVITKRTIQLQRHHATKGTKCATDVEKVGILLAAVSHFHFVDVLDDEGFGVILLAGHL